jgi:hypothetical protein
MRPLAYCSGKAPACCSARGDQGQIKNSCHFPPFHTFLAGKTAVVTPSPAQLLRGTTHRSTTTTATEATKRGFDHYSLRFFESLAQHQINPRLNHRDCIEIRKSMRLRQLLGVGETVIEAHCNACTFKDKKPIEFLHGRKLFYRH